MNLVPNFIEATEAFALVLPWLKGKWNRIAPRVPTPNVGIVDLVAKTFTVSDKHAAMKDESSSQRAIALHLLLGVTPLRAMWPKGELARRSFFQ